MFDDLLERARRAPARIALPETQDARILEGALRAARDGLAVPVLIGREAEVGPALRRLGATASELEIVDPATSPELDRYATAWHELRRHKGLDEATARAQMAEPMRHAAMAVRQGRVDGTIAGAVATTAQTVRTALQVIGKAPGVQVVSSFFLMEAPAGHALHGAALLFADCALVIQPDSGQLAQIAISTAASCAELAGVEPRVAFLSFSTHGSAHHSRVDAVARARDIARELRPDLAIDGELQFDAAIVPDVAARKAPTSAVAGRANVLVFPSLEAGNIGYKIAQRLGGFRAVGPVLQGLARPANDLSRGCSVDDVTMLLAVTGVQAGAGPGPGPRP